MSGNDQYGRRLFSWGKPLRFLASILYSEMRYLVYMRYLRTEHSALLRHNERALANQFVRYIPLIL
jgi:hypothetical protein